MEIICTLILFSEDVQNSLHTNPSRSKVATLKSLGMKQNTLLGGNLIQEKKSVCLGERMLLRMQSKM